MNHSPVCKKGGKSLILHILNNVYNTINTMPFKRQKHGSNNGWCVIQLDQSECKTLGDTPAYPFLQLSLFGTHFI